MKSERRSRSPAARIIFAKRTSLVVEGVDAPGLCQQLATAARPEDGLSFLPLATCDGVRWVNVRSVLYVEDADAPPPAAARAAPFDVLEWAPGFRP